MTDSTTPALSVHTIELPDRTIPPGQTFDCPTRDYDFFVKAGAVKPVGSDGGPKTRGRPRSKVALAANPVGLPDDEPETDLV